jgi:hypothetical protein
MMTLRFGTDTDHFSGGIAFFGRQPSVKGRFPELSCRQRQGGSAGFV